jgi:hypothetical protein
MVGAGSYVFGVVDAGARLPTPLEAALATGLRLVASGDVAAVVATPPGDRPLGRAVDLLDHDRVLADLVSSGVTVLPMRFGTVLPDDATVAAEVIESSQEELRRQLDAVRGKVQFTVRAVYEEQAVLREVVERNPMIARLRRGEAASMDEQIKLGELVVAGLADLRAAEAPRLLDELGTAAGRRERPPAKPEEVVHAAYLVPSTDANAFVDRVEEAGRRRAGRIRIRLMGPSPAYDFVGDG